MPKFGKRWFGERGHDMRSPYTPGDVKRLVPIVASVGSSSGLRGAMYLSTCAVMPLLAPGPFERSGPWLTAANAAYGALLTLSTTALFSAWGGDRFFTGRGNQSTKRLQHFGIGTALGLATFGSYVLAARQLGWLSFSGWGWRHFAVQDLVTTFAASGIEYLSVSTYEEVVFRGYGLATLSASMGVANAAALLTLLFTLAHGLEPLSLLGQGMAGVLLMVLRLSTDSVWVPLGWHFGIWYAQTALIGPTLGPPSLLPFEQDGPLRWLGRPGKPEPGLLDAVVYAGAVVAALIWWWYQVQARPRGETL